MFQNQFFVDFIKALNNIRPAKPARPVRWSLDKALSLALLPRFQHNPSVKDRTLLTLFLTALATGARVSELGALLRSPDDLVFSGDGVTIYPNPNFLAKNEHPQFLRSPIFITSLSYTEGDSRPLCQVATLRDYVRATGSTTSSSLFVNPASLKPLSLTLGATEM